MSLYSGQQGTMKNRKRGSEDFLSSSYNEYDENGKGISSRRQRIAAGCAIWVNINIASDN